MEEPGQEEAQEPQEPSAEGSEPQELAAFSERVVAFCLDAALFVACYYVTLALMSWKYPVALNPYSGPLSLLWTGLFLIYQAYLSCEDRRSLGKAALGIRVVGREGVSLGLGAAAIRSALYVASSIMNLGFLWSLFNPARRCWHDLAVGSLVVRDPPRPGGARPLVRLAAVGCIAVLAGLVGWKHVVGPRYQRAMDIAYARVGIQEIAQLQTIHHRKFGVYARDLLALAPLSGDPDAFMRDMANLLDVDSGIRIETDAKGFTITARATDDRKTLIIQKGS
ncbi:MAG: RDD family protein [Elusimicrobia bacterium]|nr:RDD family protein [Elusimicrobiota bacterium]